MVTAMSTFTTLKPYKVRMEVSTSKSNKPSCRNFFGQREKDSITANAFIQRVDNMMAANNWTDHITFRNFALVLRGLADIWLKSQETLEDITGDRRAWTIVWPFFKAEFAIESDDKRILDGLAHLAMRQTENVRDYFG